MIKKKTFMIILLIIVVWIYSRFLVYHTIEKVCYNVALNLAASSNQQTFDVNNRELLQQSEKEKIQSTCLNYNKFIVNKSFGIFLK